MIGQYSVVRGDLQRFMGACEREGQGKREKADGRESEEEGIKKRTLIAVDGPTPCILVSISTTCTCSSLSRNRTFVRSP